VQAYITNVVAIVHEEHFEIPKEHGMRVIKVPDVQKAPYKSKSAPPQKKAKTAEKEEEEEEEEEEDEKKKEEVKPVKKPKKEAKKGDGKGKK
jgi:hypothetical protein